MYVKGCKAREREREREREEVGVYQKCDVAPCRGKKVLFPLSRNRSYIDSSSSRSTQLIWQQHVLCVLKAGKRERERVKERGRSLGCFFQPREPGAGGRNYYELKRRKVSIPLIQALRELFDVISIHNYTIGSCGRSWEADCDLRSTDKLI